MKKVDAESLGPSPKFQVNIEIQLNKLLKDQAILDITQCYLNIIYEAILPRTGETIKYLLFDLNKQTQNKGFEKW